MTNTATDTITVTITKEQLFDAAERLAKSEKELRYLRRFVERATAQPEKAEPEIVTEEIVTEKMLRVRSNFGGCEILGTFSRESAKSIWYLPKGGGPEKRIAKKRQPKWRGEVPPSPHVEPCTACLDHPESHYGPGHCSIHGGKLVEGLGCPTCRST